MASIYGLAAAKDPRPQPERNNFWFRNAGTKRCLVFVHGIKSDSRDCWYAETKSSTRVPSYWPQMIKEDRQFAGYSIFLGGYKTGLSSSNYNLCDCATELLDGLKRKDQSSGHTVMECESIVFVCHSMGGIVVRHVIEKNWRLFQDKAIGLVLIASPTRGSDYANLLLPLTGLAENSQALDLHTGSSFLEYVHYRFQRILSEKRIPRFLGREATEHKGMFRGTAPIVSQQSGENYFSDPVLLPGTDHSTSVKPLSPLDRTYLLLLDFCTAFEKLLGDSSATAEATTAPSFSCDSLKWDVAIDAEGDAENVLHYRKLVTAANRLKLMSWHQSGHSSEPELLPGSSKSVSLDIERRGAHFANVVLVKESNKPVDVVIRSWDFNALSMNMGEFALKESFRPDGIDYLEKSIEEKLGLLEIEVNFPKEMMAAPSFLVHLGDADETEDASLTAKYRDNFTFSKTTRTARLKIDNPVFGRTYRISWKVPEAGANAAFSLTESTLTTLRSFAAQFFGESTDVQPQRQAAQKILDDLRTFVLQSIRQEKGMRRQPEFKALDISIVVLDTSSRPYVLRQIAGIQPTVPNPPELGLEIGDGTAGRAYKRRNVRVYEAAQAAADPKNNTYIKVPGLPEHQFLISMPMINERDSITYGVLNVGTFATADCGFLAALIKQDRMVDLAKAATAALTQLLQSLKIE